MVCDLCTCAGYLELLPEDDPEEFRARIARELQNEVHQLGGLTASDVEVRFSEQYLGHVTPPEHALCRVAESVVRAHAPAGSSFHWAGFNSGCEAGLRHAVEKTPTLVWGPGTLAEAHAVDESVAFADVELVARLLGLFCLRWTAAHEAARR
jgi:acetylornithine deacetylase